jgi:Inner membrane protein YgaP-like, transmembrane domain
MNPLISFLASPAGRVTRVVAGVALVAWGLLGLSGATAIAITAVGLIPLVAGLLDFCVFAPLFRLPLSGPKIRASH